MKQFLMAFFALIIVGCQTLDIPDPIDPSENVAVAFDLNGKRVSLNSTDGKHYNYTSTYSDSVQLIMSSELRTVDNPVGSPSSFRFDLLINPDSIDRMRTGYSAALPGQYDLEPDSSGISFKYSLDANVESFYPVSQIEWQLLDGYGQIHSFSDMEQINDLVLDAELVQIELMARDDQGNETQNLVLFGGPSPLSHLLGRIDYTVQDSLLIGSVQNAPFPYSLEINGHGMVDSFTTLYPITGKDSIYTVYNNPVEGELKFERFYYDALAHGSEVPVVSTQIRISDNSIVHASNQFIKDIVIQYIDENGALWFGLPNGFPGTSVSIISATPFVENEFGDETILVEMNWSALLVNLQSGDVAQVRDGLAILAFALPK